MWLKRRSEIKTANRLVWLGIMAGLLLLLIYPWGFAVKADAVARPERVQYVFTPFAAQLASLSQPGQIARGTTLAVFQAPEFSARSSRSQSNIQALEQRLGGLIDDYQGSAKNLSLRQQLQEQIAQANAVVEESGRLQIRAEFSGLWLDLDHDLQPGVWLNNRQVVGVLVDPSKWVVDAYVEQREIEQLDLSASARFYPENQLQPINAQVLSVDTARTKHLPYSMLAARHGGDIAVYEGDQALLPSQSLYRVRLSLDQAPAGLHETRGRVHMAGQPRSIALNAGKNFISVLLRESGF